MHIRSPKAAWAALAAAALLAACGGGDAPTAPTEQPASVTAEASPLDALRVPGGRVDVVAAPLRRASGPVDVWVTLAEASLAVKQRELRPFAPGRSWKESDAALRTQLRAHRDVVRARQDGAAAAMRALGARELARVHVAHNAIAVTVDASQLTALAAIPGVVAVRPVRHYELMLGETVPYIGGKAAQDLGYDGTGTVVAVLDSGIDYTHRNLGGPGTTAAYAAAYGAAPGDPKQTTRDGLFPTAKVIEGFDFVGEAWPGGPRTEDDDPIDYEGHGTHVADIIAGVGPNKGVAPGAKLLAVKVCSAVSSSCNGIALLKGMDYALDPNGDGDLADAADVINMSLGASYGQESIDDLAFAARNAVTLGVSVVASAGNSADKPYVTGTPAAAVGVLSVAQTQVPSAKAFPLVVTGITPSTIANTATVDWAPVGAGFSGAVVRLGRGCPAGSVSSTSPDDPYFNGNSPSGKVALIDRGACAVSLKVDRATKAGAIAVIIANNVGGDPPSFSFGGGDFPLAPTIVITQADGNRIKAALGASGVDPAVVASVSPAVSVPLVGSMVASSSRGPSYSLTAIKPEIGAPGASLSAEAATGNEETAFGGTSGAAPMVAGAAAILRGAYPDRSPEQIKAMLMNSAFTGVFTNPATRPGELAPITRIGAGEVRVDRALALTSIAHNPRAKSAALSFGFAEVGSSATLSSELLIENFGPTPKTYTITSAYRYADDAASGATVLEHPTTVTVRAGGSRKIDVRLKVDGTKLPAWVQDGGPNGGNGVRLGLNEVDGYVHVSSDGETLSVPFHALLRKSASINSTGNAVRSGNDLRLQNNGVNAGDFEVFALTGTSPRLNPTLFPAEGDNYALIDLRAVGVRAVGNVLQVAVNTWNRRSHPAYPAEIDVYVDTDGDGVDDFVLYTAELTGFAATGQVAVFVANLATGTASAFFFADADLQSGNVILSAPLAALGVGPSTPLRLSVYAFDNYFTGDLTDAIEGMRFTPGTPRFAIADGSVFGTVAARSTLRLPTTAVPGGDAASPSQSGFLLLYRANLGTEAETIAVNR